MTGTAADAGEASGHASTRKPSFRAPAIAGGLWLLFLAVMACSPVVRKVNRTQLENADLVVVARQVSAGSGFWKTGPKLTFKGTPPSDGFRFTPRLSAFSKGTAILPLTRTTDGWQVTFLPDGRQLIYPSSSVAEVVAVLGPPGKSE
ncbi:MAG: hypothetical protein AAF532_10155 [Planctomycetota bacterium]